MKYIIYIACNSDKTNSTNKINLLDVFDWNLSGLVRTVTITGLELFTSSITSSSALCSDPKLKFVIQNKHPLDRQGK